MKIMIPHCVNALLIASQPFASAKDPRKHPLTYLAASQELWPSTNKLFAFLRGKCSALIVLSLKAVVVSYVVSCELHKSCIRVIHQPSSHPRHRSCGPGLFDGHRRRHSRNSGHGRA